MAFLLCEWRGFLEFGENHCVVNTAVMVDKLLVLCYEDMC